MVVIINKIFKIFKIFKFLNKLFPQLHLSIIVFRMSLASHQKMHYGLLQKACRNWKAGLTIDLVRKM